MKKTNIGIVGCGAIGTGLAVFAAKKLKNKVKVFALADKDQAQARRLQKKIKPSPVILSTEQLIKRCDLVIEAASQAAARQILPIAIAKKRDLMILSTGALVGNAKLIEKAEKSSVKVYIPSGAICAVDGLTALRYSKIKEITLTTSKPPAGLRGADYLRKKKISVDNLTCDKVVFRGKVAQAIKCFPKNINVASTILNATGFKNVSVCIKACPKLKRNVHRLEVKTDAANLTVEIENVPSPTNPKTSYLTVLSAQSLLSKIFSSIKMGT